MKKSKKTMIKSKHSKKPFFLPPDYKPFLEDLKKHIRAAQIKASQHINQGLLELYWFIGNSILLKQKKRDGALKLSTKLLRT